MKKIKFDKIDFLKKRENLALIGMAAVLCFGIAITNVNQKIPLHDGDVLVDSTAITEEPAVEENKQTTLEEKRAMVDLERNKLLAGYDETIKNSTNDKEQQSVIKSKEQMQKFMEQEVAIESILLTKNLPQSLVVITEKSITVTVDEQDLKQNMVTKICNVVMNETGRTADKIIIQSLY